MSAPKGHEQLLRDLAELKLHRIAEVYQEVLNEAARKGSSMLDVLPRLPVGCSWSWRYSKNQTAIFAPLTRVNRPHHQARGFDQARELDRAGHCKLMGRSACNRTDI